MDKGHLTATPVGTSYLYRPARPAWQSLAGAADTLLDNTLEGMDGKLLAYMVKKSKLTPDDLAQLRALLDQHAEAETEAGPSRRRRGGPAMIVGGDPQRLGLGLGGFMARALVDSSVLLAAVVLVWLPLRRRMSAQFAHGLFLLVLLKLAVPVPASWPSWSADASLRQVGLGRLGLGGRRPAGRRRPAPGPAEADDPIVVRLGARADRRRRRRPPPRGRGRAARARPAPVPRRPRTPLTTSAVLMLAWAAVSSRCFLQVPPVGAGSTRRLIREALPCSTARAGSRSTSRPSAGRPGSARRSAGPSAPRSPRPPSAAWSGRRS